MIANAASAIEITVCNDTRVLSTVRNEVHRVIQESEFPDVLGFRIVLAVDEAVANIIKHAYLDRPCGEENIHISLKATASYFEIVVRDNGKTFDSGAVKALDMEEHLRIGKRSGLGLTLMYKIMDEILFIDEVGANELRMRKFV
jgi:serine/threonine-protein kinase RsbW